MQKDICLGVQGIVAASVIGTTWGDINFIRLLSPHCTALEKHHISDKVIRKSFGKLWVMGNYGARALKYWKPLVEEERMSLGGEHPETLMCIDYLSSAYRYLGCMMHSAAPPR